MQKASDSVIQLDPILQTIAALLNYKRNIGFMMIQVLTVFERQFQQRNNNDNRCKSPHHLTKEMMKFQATYFLAAQLELGSIGEEKGKDLSQGPITRIDIYRVESYTICDIYIKGIIYDMTSCLNA